MLEMTFQYTGHAKEGLPLLLAILDTPAD